MTACIADFDSAAAMLRAVGRASRGEDLPGLGLWPRAVVDALAPVSPLVDRLPSALRAWVYRRAGWLEAAPERALSSFDSEAIARWMTGHYDARPRPAVAVGSSNGALTHLWAWLDVPWLPQTFLVPVRRSGVSPDMPRLDMLWGREAARVLLARNPDVALHHMSDAVQDRLMLEEMAYFRLKRQTLGEAYERFLDASLEPGGTIFLVDCRVSWGTTRVGERHLFQHGALGGATEDEYRRGGPRIRGLLARAHAPLLAWDSPAPDGRSPEAEWGFDPELARDVERFASRRGLRVRRIVLEHPEDASPFVADLFRDAYARRGLPTDRLLVSSFVLLDPHLTLRSASVPFWMLFNVERSADALGAYLEGAAPFDEILMTLFSHGERSAGLAPLERFGALVASARRRGEIVGIEPGAWPRDVGNYVRYHRDLRRRLFRRHRPARLSLEELDRFVASNAGRYALEIHG